MIEGTEQDTRPPWRRTAWLSEGFEVLARGLQPISDQRPKRVHFDLVVVGSGYGGAVAAKAFAEALNGRDGPGKVGRVCVLERGREYLKGMFPTDIADLPEHVRISGGDEGVGGQRTGLFDVHVGGDVQALVANGVGGGSLINAGVMAKPEFSVLEGPDWPEALRNEGKKRWERWCDVAEKALGASVPEAPDYGGRRLPIMESLPGGTFERPALSIAIERKNSAAGVELEKCVRCGDCATGCNYGAKESLDTNLLVDAKRNGAHIYSGVTVEKLEPADDGTWILHVNYTDAKLRRRQKRTLALVASKVVLAAGVFGSTEILLRSESKKLRFSGRLGHRFSANGDTLATVIGLKNEANAVADDRVAAGSRNIGPTITSIVRKGPTTEINETVVLQDLAVPAAMRRIFQETTALATGFHDLSLVDGKKHGLADVDPCAVDERATKHALMVAMMGHDSANGRISLVPSCLDGDGGARVAWPEARNDQRLEERHNVLQKMLEGHGDARVLANPLWRILPANMEFLFQGVRGPVLTTHPLGGCPMGDDVETGVVDHYGRVFKPGRGVRTDVHRGLAVLDGSIIPSSLGINPALTITTLAMRAAKTLAGEWFPAPAGNVERPLLALEPRPFFRKLPPDAQPSVEASTQVEVLERLYGAARAPWLSGKFNFDLTLQFKPAAIEALVNPGPDQRQLDVDPNHSKLRLFTPEYWEKSKQLSDEERPDHEAFLVVPIKAGTVRLFRREPSSKWRRCLRGIHAWFLNRGLRDLWQYAWDGRRASSHTGPLKGVLALASLAGEVRLLEYDLTLGHPVRDVRDERQPVDGVELKAIKRLTYGRRSNPWQQLMTASWAGGPLRRAGRGDDLTVDLRYFEHRRVPLVRLVEQSDGVRSVIDVFSLLLYVMRIVLRVHTWSFRKPDQRPRTAPAPNRLPSAPKGMRIQRIHTIPMAKPTEAPESEPVASIRLTRFEAKSDRAEPVLMIHGYSTSGTTYAHHSVPSLARALWCNGWEPWVLDMRTSAALDTARYPWSFEQVGYADIPLAVETIRAETGKRVHVVAHCMGAAMTCMALLGDLPEDQTESQSPFPTQYDPPDPYPALRRAMRTQIASLVLSQVTPFTLYTPTNMLRSLLLRHFRHFVTKAQFSFRVDSPASVGDQLLDRLLMTIPYPKDEFDRENPPILKFMKRTPWTATRHRMDALYGRDFSVSHLSDRVLDHIDDLFGPLSMATVSQGILLARRRVLADYMGVNRFVTHKRLAERLKMPLLSLHGEENGLVDVSTAYYMRKLFAELDHGGDGVERKAIVLKKFGHQDTLIGKGAEERVFPTIIEFLDRHRHGAVHSVRARPSEDPPVRVELPELGIALGNVTKTEITVFVDNRMHHKDGDAIFAVPVATQEADSDASTRYELRAAGFEKMSAVGSKPGEVRVSRSLWDGADGVLFVVVSGPLDARPDIERIRSLLTLAGVAQCVVPARAVALDAGDKSQFCFAFGSCQYPAGLVDGTPRIRDVLPAPGPADKSYARLAHRLRKPCPELRPELLIMAGDNVYVDATAGLADPSVREGRYFTPYEQLFSSVYVQDVTRQIPLCASIDDHELMDNWEDEENDIAREAYKLGKQSYRDYLRAGSLLDGPNQIKGDKLCASFMRGGFHFFVADTRTDRKKRTAQGFERQHLISKPQRDALEAWLKDTDTSASADPRLRHRPRFIVTASSVFPRRLSTLEIGGALQSDAWCGYPASLKWLLDLIENGRHRNLVFLAGDEHRCITATAWPVEKGEFRIHCIHSSGMYTPYPFANAIPEDFVLDEDYTVNVEGRSSTWKVKAEVAPRGQGFAVIALAYNEAQKTWIMTVGFDLDGGGATDGPLRVSFPPEPEVISGVRDHGTDERSRKDRARSVVEG